MKNRLITLLNYLENEIAGELIPPQNIKLIEPLARLLPLIDFGFECRLDNHSDDSGKVDFAVSILNKYFRREIFAGLKNSESIAARLFEIEDWLRIRNFCRVWSDKLSLQNKIIRQFWLEFDIFGNLTENAIPLPRYFYSLHNNFKQSQIEKLKLLDIIENTQTILTGRKPDKILKDKIIFFSEIIGSNATLFSFGGLTDFGNSYGRISASNLTSDKIAELAERLYGFSLSIEQIRVLTEIQNISGNLCAAFDIVEKPPKIGVFCLNVKYGDTDYAAVLNKIFGYLSENKLCSLPKKNNSLSWTDKIKCAIDNDLIDEKILFLEQIGKFDLQLFVNKFVHQIKIEFYNNGDIKAKGYYGFRLFFGQ